MTTQESLTRTTTGLERPEIHGHVVTLRWHEGVGIKDAGQPLPRFNLEPSRLYLSCRGVRVGADGIGDFDCLLSEDSGRLPSSSIKPRLVAPVEDV